MLNFEKKLKELMDEKNKILAKRKEIEERFDNEIKKVDDKLKQLEDYKNQIGELTEKQVSVLTSANNLAGTPAWIKQEELSEEQNGSNALEPEKKNNEPIKEVSI